MRFDTMRRQMEQTVTDSALSGFLASGEYLDLVAQDDPA